MYIGRGHTRRMHLTVSLCTPCWEIRTSQTTATSTNTHTTHTLCTSIKRYQSTSLPVAIRWGWSAAPLRMKTKHDMGIHTPALTSTTPPPLTMTSPPAYDMKHDIHEEHIYITQLTEERNTLIQQLHDMMTTQQQQHDTWIQRESTWTQDRNILMSRIHDVETQERKLRHDMMAATMQLASER